MIKWILMLMLVFSVLGLAADHDCRLNTTATLSKLSPVDEDSEDCGFLVDMRINFAGVVDPLVDFYWANSCNNSIDGIMEFTRERPWPMPEIDMLSKLKERSLSDYNSTLYSYRALNCNDDQAFKNYTQILEKRVEK
jgi:hypothetical protein